MPATLSLADPVSRAWPASTAEWHAVMRKRLPR